MKRKLFFAGLLVLCISEIIQAQLLVTDHEGNEYEYARLADGRNWMLENLRATTNLSGNPVHVYYSSAYSSQEEAGFYTGFAYLREELLGSSGPSAVRTYSARTRGLCPEGWYVPELGGAAADYSTVITAYGGIVSNFSDPANWDAWKAAMRLSLPGYNYSKFQTDPGTKEIVSTIGGGQHHLITSGHWGRPNLALLLNVGGPDMTWGGMEENANYAGYCRCVENVHATATFNNFSAFGVDISFSEPLKKNYSFNEIVTVGGVDVPVSEICPRNFLIKDYATGNIIPVNAVYISEDRKNVQLDADFDESKIYELVMVDSKLRENNVPYGGYTFNGGTKMYFPQAPQGINVLEGLQMKVGVEGNYLVIEQFGRKLDASVYDVRGVKRLSTGGLTGIEYINISGLSGGIYVLQLSDPVSNQKIIRKFAVK